MAGLGVSILVYRRDRPLLRVAASQVLSDKAPGWHFAITIVNPGRHAQRLSDIGVVAEAGDRLTLIRMMALRKQTGEKYSLAEPMLVPPFDSHIQLAPLAEAHAAWLSQRLGRAASVYAQTTWGREYSSALPRHLGELLETGRFPNSK